MLNKRCEAGQCARKAFIHDERRGLTVCLDHRLWPCHGCDAEHDHRTLSRYSDDFEHWLSCRETGAILMMGFWQPYAVLPPGTTIEDTCWSCMGLGRCQCVGAELGAHERCLRCEGSERCTRCGGTGLKHPPKPQ